MHTNSKQNNYPNYRGVIKPETKEEIELYNKLKSEIPTEDLDRYIRKYHTNLLKPAKIILDDNAIQTNS